MSSSIETRSKKKTAITQQQRGTKQASNNSNSNNNNNSNSNSNSSSNNHIFEKQQPKKRKLTTFTSEQPTKQYKHSSNNQHQPHTTKVVSNHLNRINTTSMLRNSGNKPVKKLVIKNLKEVPQLPENYEEETWKKLSETVKAIFSQSAITENKQTLYTAVRDLCSNKFSHEMFQRLKTLIETHLEEKSKIYRDLCSSLDPDSYLSEFNLFWQSHCEHIRMIRNIFEYLDRTFVNSLEVRSLWDLGLSLFAVKILGISTISEKIIQKVLLLIKNDRDGGLADKSLLVNIIRMLVSLQLYHDLFEELFLSQSKEYYFLESHSTFENSSISEYLKYIGSRLKHESHAQYLEKTTMKPLISIVEKELISEKCYLILDKGFDSLIDKTLLDDLALLYSFFDRVDQLLLLEDYFSKYIKSAVLEIVLPPENDSNMIDNLLLVKTKLDSILKLSFKSNPNFENTLKKSLENAINKRENRPSELLAKFIDSKLKSSKGESEEELEGVLDNALSIFRLMEGKDVFQAFFRNDLAKRLLLGKSSDFDTERSLIAKIRQECGAAFTHKFESMFTDMDISNDIMRSFNESKFSQEISPPDFSLTVNILTTGTWPYYPAIEMNLPSIVANNQQIFMKFYLHKYKGRKLTWLNSMGHCILNAQFPSGKKIFSVSLFQTSVLLLFNSSICLSYLDIEAALKLNAQDLKLTLQSLACGKVRVLSKNPKGKDINENDQFVVNTKFVHKLVRIRINSIQMQETKEERDKTNSNILEERKYAIDAAIVRIMKERKTLSYNVLVTELFSQLRFPVQPSVIKDRVTSLIEREYLERDEKNDQKLHYMA